MSRERVVFSKEARLFVWARDLTSCRYCGKRVPFNKFEVDHIHPFSKGGSDSYINLATACVTCNRKKSDNAWVPARIGLFNWVIGVVSLMLYRRYS